MYVYGISSCAWTKCWIRVTWCWINVTWCGLAGTGEKEKRIVRLKLECRIWDCIDVC